MVQTVPHFVSQWTECTLVTVRGGLSVSKTTEIQLPIVHVVSMGGMPKLTVPLAHLFMISNQAVLNVSLVEIEVLTVLHVTLAMIHQPTAQSVCLVMICQLIVQNVFLMLSANQLENHPPLLVGSNHALILSLIHI